MWGGRVMGTYRIGLTGNIATGKSLVLKRLSEFGAYCLDGDELAHDCLLPGHPAVAAVVRRFGTGVLAAEGQVNRAALAAIVFRDGQALADLEAILHPYVIDEIERRLAEAAPAVAAIEAIKLLEASLASRCQAVWVVTCSRERQLERLMGRRGFSEPEAIVRLEAQPPAEMKVVRADVLLENDGSVGDLLATVAAEWSEIQAGVAPGQDGALGTPERCQGTWTVREGAHWATAEPLGPGSYRLAVDWPSRLSRLCRPLLPALEREAAASGEAQLTLRVPAKTGYRQFLKGMGYREGENGGRERGEVSFSRIL